MVRVGSIARFAGRSRSFFLLGLGAAPFAACSGENFASSRAGSVDSGLPDASGASATIVFSTPDAASPVVGPDGSAAEATGCTGGDAVCAEADDPSDGAPADAGPFGEASDGAGCAAGTHACSADAGITCADNTSVNSCGTACAPCPDPPSNATATCTAPDAGANGCGWACNPGYTLCNGACVDTTTDLANCGTCGYACPGVAGAVATCAPGGSPRKGSCVYTCSDGAQKVCGASCVSVNTDVSNCGACGHACTAVPGAVDVPCVNGACSPHCSPASPMVCGSGANEICTDLKSDPDNCGRCGHSCAPAACENGMCLDWVVSTPAFPLSVASDGQYVAWFDSYSASCYAAPAKSVNVAPMALAPTSFGIAGSPGAVAMSSGAVACATTRATGRAIWITPATTASATPSITLNDTASAGLYAIALSAATNTAYAAEADGLYVCPFGATPTACSVSLAPTATPTTAGGVVVAGDHLLWAEGGNVVRPLTLAGQSAGAPIPTMSLATAIASDGNKVYWTEGNNGFYVNWQSLTAATERTIATVTGIPIAIASDGTYAYVAVGSSGQWFIYAVSTSASNVTVSPGATGFLQIYPIDGRVDGSTITSLALANGVLYWTQYVEGSSGPTGEVHAVATP